MQHELKILPEYFDAVNVGLKNFEIRKNDRNYKAGDILLLREWNGEQYTGRAITRNVTYIYYGCGDFGLAPGYCILGFNNGPRVVVTMNGDNNTQIGYVQNLTL